MTRHDAFIAMVMGYARIKNSDLRVENGLGLPAVLDAALCVQDSDLDKATKSYPSLLPVAYLFTNFLFDRAKGDWSSTKPPEWLPEDWDKRGYNFNDL